MDGQILLWLQDNLRNPILDSIFVFITTLGNAGIIWALIAIILLIVKATRKAGVCCITAGLAILILNEGLIKHLINRARPFTQVEGLTILIKAPGSSSFPSGHTATSFAATTVMLLMLPKKYSIPALILASSIAFSRLYVGVHYPTDVLGGLIMGVIYGLIGFFAGGRFYDRIEEKQKLKAEAEKEE